MLHYDQEGFDQQKNTTRRYPAAVAVGILAVPVGLPRPVPVADQLEIKIHGPDEHRGNIPMLLQNAATCSLFVASSAIPRISPFRFSQGCVLVTLPCRRFRRLCPRWPKGTSAPRIGRRPLLLPVSSDGVIFQDGP